MSIIVQLMLLFLIVCAVAVCVTRALLTSVVIYMAYSMIMSIVWITMQSPDLAITEAAVGAGVTSILFIITLKKIHAIAGDGKKDKEMTQNSEDTKNMMQEEHHE